MKKAIFLMAVCSILIFPLRVSAEPTGNFFRYPLGMVIIDPGHGGDDPGAVVRLMHEDGSATEVYEKDINLAVAARIAEVLATQLPNVAVLMTREDDSYLSLQQRARYANDAVTGESAGKLFISVHANTAPVPEATGFEIWKLPESVTFDFLDTDIPEALFTAAVNSSNSTLNRALDRADALIAHAVELELALGLAGITRNRGIKESNFYVLGNTYMPAILIETGFMSNDEELRLLLDLEYQQQVAEGVVRGIVYFAQMMSSE